MRAALLGQLSAFQLRLMAINKPRARLLAAFVITGQTKCDIMRI